MFALPFNSWRWQLFSSIEGDAIGLNARDICKGDAPQTRFNLFYYILSCLFSLFFVFCYLLVCSSLEQQQPHHHHHHPSTTAIISYEVKELRPQCSSDEINMMEKTDYLYVFYNTANPTIFYSIGPTVARRTMWRRSFLRVPDWSHQQHSLLNFGARKPACLPSTTTTTQHGQHLCMPCRVLYRGIEQQDFFFFNIYLDHM